MARILVDADACPVVAGVEEMAEKCTNFGKRTLPGIRELGKAEMVKIYSMAMG